MSAPVIYFDLGNTLIYGPPDNRQAFDDALPTITELWWRGYKIGLLSDQNPGTSEQNIRDRLDAYGLESFRFDVITLSSDFTPPIYKPNPQIFEAAVTNAGHSVASQNTVFVTENLDHINAARDLGWRAIHIPYGGSCTAASGECVEDLDDLLALFPQLAIDIYIRDAVGDPGDDHFSGSNFWNSPDLWIRNQKDDGLSHQNPEAGQDNWFYARVHNRGVGICRMFYVGFSVKEWLGTQFIYPGDYLPYISDPFALGNRIGVNLEPDDAMIIYTKWAAEDVPPAGTHACWLAAAQPFLGGADLPFSGAHVWEHNNLAQKNLSIVDLIPGDSIELPIVLGSRQIDNARYYTLELYRSKQAIEIPVSIIGQSARTLEKLVRAGKEFVHTLPQTVNPAEDVGFRFVDSARVELTGIETQENAVVLNLESGSTLTLSSLRPIKNTDTLHYNPRFTPARLMKKKDGSTELVFAQARASGMGVAFRAQHIVHAKLVLKVPKNAMPGEHYDLDLIQRGDDGRIEGGISVRVNVKRKRVPKHTLPKKKKKLKKATKTKRAKG